MLIYVCVWRICVWISLLSAFFFFFKQKTAYEMRISDWSSDVCSSDLHIQQWITSPLLNVSMVMLCCYLETHVLVPGAAIGYGPPEHLQKIGRASCRERVCQYV